MQGFSVVDETREQVTATEQRPRRRWWRRTWFRVLVVVVVVWMAAVIVVTEYVIHHAEPMLRARVVDTLSARFHAPVQLDELHISLIKGVQLAATGVKVEGSGLRIPYIGNGDQRLPDHDAPLISIQHFAFHTRIRGLLRQPTRILEVDVDGMQLRVPRSRAHSVMEGSTEPRHPPKISLLVNRIRCKNVTLVIETNKPGKDPLEFDIQKLDLQDVGQAQPFTYQAELTNPVPVGEIHASGHFGPWDVEDPRETALDGSYSFSHADLGTIKGIRGTLSSHGQFAGVLDNITIDGETSTPDFALDVSDHPMPLHTVFHAYVNSTDGDTYLEPVHARLAQSDFTAQGKVVVVKGKGHDIDMNVDIPHGHVQDFLELGVKTRPPLMSGLLTMKGHLQIPPGDRRVPDKIQLVGNFQLRSVEFNNPAIQDKVDGLSARAQGKPKEIAAYSTDKQAEVSSMMSAKFELNHGLMNVHDLKYAIPGALVLMNGVYSTDGNLFEFKGHVRTDATASQMVTGWKSWLLKPVDHFLAKDGAGLELPISISGTEGNVHFGLALHGTSAESNEAMAQDLKLNRAQMIADAKVKSACEAAVKEQQKADATSDGKPTKAQRKAEKQCEKARQEVNDSKEVQESAAAARKAREENNAQLHDRLASPQP